MFSRMTTQPPPARRSLIDEALRSLAAGGVLERGDMLSVLAAHDAQAGRLNWLSSSYNLTAVGAPAFTADRGYTGDGATARLDTGFDPVAAAGEMTLNSASIGVWMPGTSGTANNPVGNLNATVRPRAASTSLTHRLNNTTTATTAAVGAISGFYLLNRTGAAGYDIWLNGIKILSPTAAASAMSAMTIQLLARQTSLGVYAYDTSLVAAAWAGGGLTDVQCVALYAALSGYLTAIGAA